MSPDTVVFNIMPMLHLNAAPQPTLVSANKYGWPQTLLTHSVDVTATLKKVFKSGSHFKTDNKTLHGSDPFRGHFKYLRIVYNFRGKTTYTCTISMKTRT